MDAARMVAQTDVTNDAIMDEDGRLGGIPRCAGKAGRIGGGGRAAEQADVRRESVEAGLEINRS